MERFGNGGLPSQKIVKKSRLGGKIQEEIPLPGDLL
jgi:hypothetical protein